MTDVETRDPRLLFADAVHPEPHPYAGRPAAWVTDVLHEHLWSAERAIMDAVYAHTHVAVPSSHDTGKSYTAGRIIAHFIDQYPPGDAFAVTCYADDVEVLTRAGWKLFADVTIGPDGDQFATRNQITKAMEWQYATRYYESWWDGEVVDLVGRGLRLRVTPNHRVLKRWMATGGQSGEVFVRADSLRRRSDSIPATSGWEGKSPGSVRFGRYEWSAVDFAAFLGAWLAEGSLGPARVHVAISDRKRPDRHFKHGGSIVLTQLPGTKGYGPYVRLLTRLLGRPPAIDDGRNLHFNCSELWHYLRALGKAPTKHIPAEVKDWGVEALDALLYHYLLGDGHYAKPNGQGSGSWKAWTSSPRLADDLQEIAQKLGGWASITKRQPRRGGVIDGRRIVGRHPSYQLCFNTSRCRDLSPRRSHYEGFVRCVSVPNETLYVRPRGQSPIWCGNTAPTDPQVKAILWQEIAAAWRKGKLAGRVLENAQWKMDGGRGPGILVAHGRKPAEQGAVGLFGIHRKHMLVVVDEAGGVPKSIFEAIESLTTSEDVHVIAIGNPDDPHSAFAGVCKPGSGWHVIELDGLRSPNFTAEEVAKYPDLRRYMIAEGIGPSTEVVPDDLRAVLLSPRWVNERLQRWRPSNPLFISRVRGRFPPVGEHTLIEPRWVLAAQRRERVPETGSPRMGVDVARYGSDKTVIATRLGPVVRCVVEIAKGPVTEVAGEVMRVSAVLSAARVPANIDDDGVGGGVTDILVEQHWPVLPLHGQSRCNETMDNGRPRFVNARSEWWWNLREALAGASGTGEDGYLDIDPDDEELAAQLLAPTYAVNSRGQIAVESKDDMRKRGVASPDHADAVAYSLVVAADASYVEPRAMLTSDIDTMQW